MRGMMSQVTPADGPSPAPIPGPEEPKSRISSRRAAALTIAAAVVVVVLAVAIVPHFLSKGSGNGDGPQLATAAVQSFPVTVSASGTVVPASEIPENFPTSGQISQINVQLNQKVTRGTVLAQLNGSVAQSDVAHAEAAVASANAALSAAEHPLTPGTSAELQSALQAAESVYNSTVSSVQVTNAEDAAAVVAEQQLLTADGCSATGPTNALVCQDDQATLQSDQARVHSDAADGQLRISQAQSSVAQAQAAIQGASTANPSAVASAQAGVNAANAELQQAQDELANLSLIAQTDGTVVAINGQVGENVTGAPTGAATLPGTTAPIPAVPGVTGSGSGSASNQPLMVLASSSGFVVGAAFPTTAMPQLSAHQVGTITDSSLSGLSLPCRVLAIAQSPTTVTNNSSVVWASVIPTGPTDQLYPGMSVSVNVDVSRANNVLAVPQSAIFLVNGQPHVNVWNGNHSVSTTVTTGAQGTTLIQITSGLSSGEQVVLSAFQGLPQQSPTTLGGAPQ